MKTTIVPALIEQDVPGRRNPHRIGLVALAVCLCLAAALLRSGAQTFPPQGDDTTPSMGVFRITVNPAFYPLVAPSGGLLAYPGYNGAAGKLTSPLCVDNATTIGRSSPNAVPYPAAFPVAIGTGSWDTVLGYGDYAAIPALWSGAPLNTEEVLTEIKSFNLMSVADSAGQHCPPDPRIPSVPLAWPMVRAGTFAGVAPRSLGMVDENVPNGAANPDFPAHSFFDVFVEVNLPPVGGTVSGTEFPGTGAVLYNDVPLIITNLNLNSFPPQVIYIHGITPAVPLKFRSGNAPYWNAGDVFGYLVLAGHGTITNDCSSTPAVQGLLNAVLGPIGNSQPELPIEWPRTNVLCPTPFTTYNSAQGTNADGSSADEVKFTVPGLGTIHARNFVHSNFPNPINPPTPGNTAVYTAPSTQVAFDSSFDGVNWNSSVASGPLTTKITNTTGTGSTSTFDTEMLQLDLTAGTLRLRESPTKQSLGKHTIRPDAGIYRISSFFDVFLELSIDGGNTWTPADRAIRVQPSPAPPQPTPTVPEYFNPQPLLPPPGSVYISPALWHVLYAQGIVIRDVRHRFFTQNYPLPALGGTAIETFSSEVDFDLSTDNGATFQPASGTASVNVHVTHTRDVGNTMFFSTEMVQLDLQGPGFTLRESPTLQSTGQTTVRSVPGGYMVSSFFDIFTELSTDNGLSWQPASSPGHVEMRPDTKTVTPASQPTPLLPSPGGAYVSPQQWHALYAQGIVIKDVSHKLFTSALQPPTPGTTSGHSFDSQLDLQLSTDGGSTYQSIRVAAPVTVTVISQGSTSNPLYDTEMNELRLTLPSGVMIRESPTEPSRGQTAMVAQPDGTYRISSFFDIFTELSLDGGASWAPATNGPVRVQLVPVAPEVPKPNLNLPPLDGSYVSPQQWHALYANGIIITNASHDRFTQTQSPPAPGSSQTENFGSTVSGAISLDGGASFQPFQAPANVAVQVSSRADLDTGSTRFFDTEMLSLDLSGGTLPGGIMVRESPTKASLGRTSARTAATGYQISSFFDIFTEVSLDGGQTWSPSVTKPGTMGLTPGTAVTIVCPSNITVTATSSSGAVVFYTVTASGGCPPVSVVANPPSGSTFPIGTTTVTAMASDTCGNSAQCSFTVTVLPLTTPGAPEYFFPQPILPPPGSMYISPAQWHALFAQGIVIRDVRHRFFTQNYPLPPLGTSQTETFSSEVDFDLSTDNGGTFQPASGTANVTVQVTHSQDSAGTSFFDTEMLQLDLAGPGFLLRESPTLQSTGQTTVRPVAGGYMISSFFDIFTELSVDNGMSWTPAQQPGHVEMRPDPKQVTPVPQPTPLLPPPGGAYVSPQQWHALYAQGIVIKDVSHRLFTGALQPPATGATSNETFNSQIDLQVSTDGGSTYQYMRVAAPVQVTVTSHGSTASTVYDTEMTSLAINLPNGVMIRESPTEPSRGVTEVDGQSDGTYRISSFFDIFTELSLDGGASWSPATNGPVRVELVPIAPEVPKPNLNLPPLDGSYVSPQQWHALYANGIIITNASHDRFTQTQSPPAPGSSQTENFGSTVSGAISLDGGASFQPFQAPANVAVQVSSRADLDTGSTRFFDTEMLSLDLSGGTLPGGIMVRESPTKASLGRTSARTAATGYQISSFFDIFTEVSLDGGQTWSPSVTKPGTMGLGTNVPANCIVSIACPTSITVTSVGPAVVTFVVTASDTCGGTPAIVSVPPSGSTFPVGTTTVNSTASDANGTAHCSFTVTVVSKQRVFPSGGKLPPTNSVYISPAMWHAQYANGIYISNVVHRAFTANFPPPTSGTTSNETFGSKVDFMYSTDGKTFQKYTGNATCTVRVTNTGGDAGGSQMYQTEMLQLDLSGGSMPSNVRLRESPTLQSTGQTLITPVGNGNYQISSFFDIFTELSLDGGQSWSPSSSPGHMELHIDPANPPTVLTQPKISGTQLNFNVPTQVGLRYTVKYAASLTSTTWNTLIVVSGNGQNLVVTDPEYPTNPIRFYRVVIDEDPNQ